MSDIDFNLKSVLKKLHNTPTTLVAVSKTKPISDIEEAYAAGQREFGENKVQELVQKYESLPKDIKWHMIGHLQRNKVKFIAPFVHLIHSVDTIKLMSEINKEAKKSNRKINCLLQIHIADETTKFGFLEEELVEMINEGVFESYENISFIGLMGMATNTNDITKIENEFAKLKLLFDKIKSGKSPSNFDFKELSMGMSSDYEIAIKKGSTMVRVGSTIFGSRHYA